MCPDQDGRPQGRVIACSTNTRSAKDLAFVHAWSDPIPFKHRDHGERGGGVPRSVGFLPGASACPQGGRPRPCGRFRMHSGWTPRLVETKPREGW